MALQTVKIKFTENLEYHQNITENFEVFLKDHLAKTLIESLL